MEEPRVMFIDIPVSKSRSVSPMSPSPCRERNLGFFEMLSRRFGRRSHDELCFQHTSEEDSRSSSTDSSSSTSVRHANPPKNIHNSNMELTCSNSDSNSSSSSSGSSTTSESAKNSQKAPRMHRRSTSSIRQALQNFSISSRSLSCSSTPSKEQKQKKTKKSPPPKRILRQPVAYTYLKGTSGLPTQRVPRSSVCTHYSHR